MDPVQDELVVVVGRSLVGDVGDGPLDGSGVGILFGPMVITGHDGKGGGAGGR